MVTPWPRDRGLGGAGRGALILPGGAGRGALVSAPQRPCQPCRLRGAAEAQKTKKSSAVLDSEGAEGGAQGAGGSCCDWRQRAGHGACELGRLRCACSP